MSSFLQHKPTGRDRVCLTHLGAGVAVRWPLTKVTQWDDQRGIALFPIKGDPSWEGRIRLRPSRRTHGFWYISSWEYTAPIEGTGMTPKDRKIWVWGPRRIYITKRKG